MARQSWTEKSQSSWLVSLTSPHPQRPLPTAQRERAKVADAALEEVAVVVVAVVVAPAAVDVL